MATVTVSSGQTYIVSSGQHDTGDTVLAGGIMIVDAGGIVSTTTIDSGGLLTVAGGAEGNATISGGGSLTVLSGGSTGGDVINGGTETVSSGGATVQDTINSGGSLVLSGGHSEFNTINSGGSEIVLAGGNAVEETISGGGSLTVSSGGSATADTINSGGSEIVLSGGFADGGVFNSGGSLVLSGGVAGAPGGSGGIVFKGSGGQLQIYTAAMPSSTISGFVPGDSFDLTRIAVDQTSGSANLTSGNVLQITESGTTYDLDLNPSESFTGDTFQVVADSGSGTLVIENNMPCYCRGTLIGTKTGAVPVEELAIDDMVITFSGAARPVKWIGRRSYAARFVAGNRAVLPVRIEAGALAHAVPARDLWISPEHALYVNGVLVPARLLANGATIIQVGGVEQVDYFHIELDAHDIIFAEGAPAETFVDCDNRFMFHNAGEFAALYPGDRRPAWRLCAPRLDEASAELAAIRTALLARAEALGYRRTDDPDLHLIVDGEVVRAQAVEDGVYRFAIPPGSGAVWLASRNAVPAEVEGSSADRRRLGVPFKAIVLRGIGRRSEIGHGHPSLRQGFHEDEEGHRWTDGIARLPDELLRPFAGEVTIEIHLIRPGLRYPLDSTASTAKAA